jgi:hypothetical protein
MGTPVACPKCGVPNGLLAKQCRICGVSLRGTAPKVRPLTIRRVDAADWRTQDLHRKYPHATGTMFAKFDGDLHKFLEYCLLLKRLAGDFTGDDQRIWYDGCAFFLRGGYPLFAFMNTTTSLTLRATIFGGLNHARGPRQAFVRWLQELRDSALAHGSTKLNLMVGDEANSGTGLGPLFNLVSSEMGTWGTLGPFFVDLTVYAVCPGDAASAPFAAVSKKWQGTRRILKHKLAIRIAAHFGNLLAYDDDVICGVRKVSRAADPHEDYELVHLTGGRLSLSCPEKKKPIIVAQIGRNRLANFIGKVVEDVVYKPRSAWTTAPVARIQANGCQYCHRSLREVYA